jgi:hypothetical protein
MTKKTKRQKDLTTILAAMNVSVQSVADGLGWGYWPTRRVLHEETKPDVEKQDALIAEAKRQYDKAGVKLKR